MVQFYIHSTGFKLSMIKVRKSGFYPSLLMTIGKKTTKTLDQLESFH